jgi:hypothetical protein
MNIVTTHEYRGGGQQASPLLGTPGAPFCHVCQHTHEQGTRCPVCGHSGRANVFRKMRDRSNLCRAYEIEHLNQYSCPDDISGLKIICDELRRRLFVEEMGIPAEEEFSDAKGHFNYSFGKGKHSIA